MFDKPELESDTLGTIDSTIESASAADDHSRRMSAQWDMLIRQKIDSKRSMNVPEKTPTFRRNSSLESFGSAEGEEDDELMTLVPIDQTTANLGEARPKKRGSIMRLMLQRFGSFGADTNKDSSPQVHDGGNAKKRD